MGLDHREFPLPPFHPLQTSYPDCTRKQFFTWCAAFALNHKYFSNGIYVAALEESGFPSVDAVVAGQWFALTAMLLFLISALMGPACLLMDRKSLFASRGVVQS